MGDPRPERVQGRSPLFQAYFVLQNTPAREVALPALSLAGLGIKDIMGYCFTFAIVSGIVISVCFLVL